MFYPRFLNFLPGPGEWMVSLSQFMAFPLLGAVVWLLWVLQGLQGTSLVFFTLICLLIAGFAFWVLLRFKKSGLSAIIILLLFVLNLTQASPLKSRFLADHSLDKKSDNSIQSLNWRKFDPAQVQKSLDDQKRVFINFTADWCITCKVNETLVFENAEVISFLKSHDITLYKADWTKRNPEITEQLKKYNRIGVPLYVFFHTADEKPMILPEILTPSSFQKQLIPYVK
jgi:thiol:disulfide interchange protein DsbD